jgi:hypothetical protein
VSLTYQPTTHRLGPLAGGVGVSLAGHVLTVALGYAVGWLMGGPEGQAAGAKLAIAVVGFAAMFVGQGVLLSIVVPVGIVSLKRRRTFGIGLFAGYFTGLLIIATLIVWLLTVAAQCEVCANVQV